MKKLTAQLAVICTLAVVTGLVMHHRVWRAAITPPAQHAAAAYAPLPVTLEFVQSWQQQRRLIVDARPTAEYRAGHLAGAHSLPVAAAAELAAALRRDGGGGGEVVVYCSSIHCSDSFEVGEILHRAGFATIYLYEAGFAEWQAAALPLSREQP